MIAGKLSVDVYSSTGVYPVPTVSVIAAAHNQDLHIHQAIQSVLNQSFQDIELIVTDDGSTDGTLDVIRLFSGMRG